MLSKSLKARRKASPGKQQFLAAGVWAPADILITSIHVRVATPLMLVSFRLQYWRGAPASYFFSPDASGYLHPRRYLENVRLQIFGSVTRGT